MKINKKDKNKKINRRLMFFGLGFWLILYIISPFSYTEKLSFDWYILIFLNIFCFQICKIR